MKAPYIFWIVLGAVACGWFGCAKKTHNGIQEEPRSDTQPFENSDDEWNNPILNHLLNTREEPYRSFPFDKKLSDIERLDSAGFNDFNRRMNFSFEESKLSQNDADFLYSIIQKSVSVQDDSNVLKPHSNYESPDILKMETIRKRFSIKKTSEDRSFEVYYKFYSCGWNYSFNRIEISLSDSTITKIEEIESWVAQTPC